MRMFWILLLLLVPVHDAAVAAQTDDQPSAFISANFGGFLTSNRDFSKVYDSNLGLAFGASLGLPLSAQSYLYGKVTYFSKTGVPVLYTYHVQNGTLVSTTEWRTGTARFKQWIVNFGSQYNVFLSENVLLGINGGFTYSSISDDQSNPDGSEGASAHGNGLLGLFVGAGLEKRFAGSPISAFAEGQYNYGWPVISATVGNYGGLNLTVGIRYYFRDRRKP